MPQASCIGSSRPRPGCEFAIRWFMKKLSGGASLRGGGGKAWIKRPQKDGEAPEASNSEKPSAPLSCRRSGNGVPALCRSWSPELKGPVVAHRGLGLEERHRAEARKTWQRTLPSAPSLPACLSISSRCLPHAERSRGPASGGLREPGPRGPHPGAQTRKTRAGSGFEQSEGGKATSPVWG